MFFNLPVPEAGRKSSDRRALIFDKPPAAATAIPSFVDAMWIMLPLNNDRRYQKEVRKKDNC